MSASRRRTPPAFNDDDTMAAQPWQSCSYASSSSAACSSSINGRRSSPSLVKRVAVFAAVAALAASSVAAQATSATVVPAGSPTTALHEPQSTRVLFGGWVETDWGDTPYALNQRLGHNLSVIQIAQSIPLIPYNWNTGAGGKAPEYMIERSASDAAVFLTVYPNNGGLNNVSMDDFTALGNQILNWTTNYNRTVFLRYAPEFQGDWFPYGRQPLAFVKHWRVMYPAIKAIVPNVAIVWAPNTGQGYPYGMQTSSNATEAAALDTNKDGQLSYLDSPFAPYYPGDDVVDWIGLSVYYKGPGSQNVNVPQVNGYCYDALNNINPNAVNQIGPDPFYQTYCTKPGKACMFSESAAAYHDMILGDQGVSDYTLKMAWVNDCLTNRTFFQQYPRMKLMMQFEYKKNETDGGIPDSRDFRLTNKTDVLNGFKSALAGVADIYTWANYRPIPTSTPNVATQTSIYTTTDSHGVLVTTTAAFTTSTFSFITVRNTQTSFPSLFGNLPSSAAKAVVVSVAMFGTACSVVLGGMIFLMRA